MQIEYCDGFKYQLRKNFAIELQIPINESIEAPLVRLIKNGEYTSLLAIQPYFAWDGCSGPTIDDKTNMRAGLVHDALYYLMRLDLLDIDCRPLADAELERIMMLDRPKSGVGKWFGKIRAKYYRLAVEWFAEPCAKGARKVFKAP